MQRRGGEGGGRDEKRRYIPMRSAAAMMMRNDDILTRRGGKNGEDRLESLSLPPSCGTGCLTSKKSDKDPLTGCPWNILLFLLSLYVYHYVSLTAFLVSLNILCTYRAVYITSSRPRSLEGVICAFAADFSLTFFPAFFHQPWIGSPCRFIAISLNQHSVIGNSTKFP
jgi:hypothetical protein